MPPWVVFLEIGSAVTHYIGGAAELVLAPCLSHSRHGARAGRAGAAAGVVGVAVEEADERDPPLAGFHQRLVPVHALFQLRSRISIEQQVHCTYLC